MEDLLSAGSIQSGNFVVAPRVTHLDAIVTDALELVSPSIEARGQRVDVELPHELAAVWADARYTRQVLTNLLANASKYSPERPVMRIVAAPEDTMVRISVSDQGPGIPIEQRAGLFERFYHVRSHTDAAGCWTGHGNREGYRRCARRQDGGRQPARQRHERVVHAAARPAGA